MAWKDEGTGGKGYVYSQEISQMTFVFAEVTDPDESVLKLIEDIVRAQCVELLVQSRKLAIRRNSKFLAAEDLIFLIRHDRAKVNRLRTYLSWKDVRKNAKESGGDAGGTGGPGGEIDGLDDGAMDTMARTHVMKLKMPWEISTIYSENLRALQNEDDEEQDEDDLEAQEASLQRLKEADDATRHMTREEYVHYSECRQASFTWRKGKRFREFINAGAYIDVKPNDDIIDILGFLAYEVVRELCISAVAIRDAEEERNHTSTESIDKSNPDLSKEDEYASGNTSGLSIAANSRKRKMTIDSTTSAGRNNVSPRKRARQGNGPSGEATSTYLGEGNDRNHTGDGLVDDGELCSLFTVPASKHVPLTAAHVQEAFARVQRDNAALASSGPPGPPGGLRRTRLFVI
ncbi:TFIID-18kDa-domain-containing protein [Tilletiaria anomala UBC 951]|uniref:TFIID-18kDa-domain-containing protein n=1 Tax=Tilletiaria anomala (strain ATCC 24038 / CBS 436.72 / UBC 951) TaxID=1037660 RepID=A0A066W3Z8_TILAU|nr:TFIID-18kDa-domain-containing protein [Tilletiaria anomala UBC 951]KDN48436.1 TFIID-18kDa-domain-containing protein [Tilletiaria anomala UBC 951]